MVRGSRRLRHDFSSGGPCVVRLQLAVRNCLRQAASVSVEAGPQHSASSDGARIFLSSRCCLHVFLLHLDLRMSDARRPARCKPASRSAAPPQTVSSIGHVLSRAVLPFKLPAPGGSVSVDAGHSAAPPQTVCNLSFARFPCSGPARTLLAGHLASGSQHLGPRPAHRAAPHLMFVKSTAVRPLDGNSAFSLHLSSLQILDHDLNIDILHRCPSRGCGLVRGCQRAGGGRRHGSRKQQAARRGGGARRGVVRRDAHHAAVAARRRPGRSPTAGEGLADAVYSQEIACTSTGEM